MVQDSSKDVELTEEDNVIEMTKSPHHEMENLVGGVYIGHLGCNEEIGLCRSLHIDLDDGTILLAVALGGVTHCEIENTFEEWEDICRTITSVLKPNPPIPFPKVAS